MKKISLLLIVSLCMLGGCKDDLLKEGGGENGLTTEGTNYMAFNIVSDGGATTRAWPGNPTEETDFDAGSEGEQAITTAPGSNVALFFRADNSFHSMRELTRVANSGDASDRQPTERTVGTFVANLKIEEGQEGSLPTKVLIVLNGNSNRLDGLERAIKATNKHIYDEPDAPEAQSDAEYALAYLTRRLSDETIAEENASVVIFSPAGIPTEYCTMTNAVYVGSGEKEGDETLAGKEKSYQTGKIYNLALIGEKNIQATEDLAKENPLTVHVERMAVKVEVDFDKNLGVDTLGTGTSNPAMKRGGFKYPLLLRPKGTGATTQVKQATGTAVATTDVDWAFAMLGWSTNAVARRMYLFKNLNDARNDLSKSKDDTPHYEGGLTKDPDSKEEIKTAFFGFWNDVKRARSYWAVDGHYANPNVYPVQYRDAKDNTTTHSYMDIPSSDTIPLYYYSYTQMRMINMGLVPNAPSNLTADTYSRYLQRGNLRSDLRYRYCGENVLGQKLIDNTDHIWRGAATHVVFIGQLLLGNEIQAYQDTCKKYGNQLTEGLLNSVPDKLYAGGCYWNRADYMQDAFTKIYRGLTTSSRTITDYFGGGGKDIELPDAKTTVYYVKGDVEEILDSEYFQKIAAKEGKDKVTADTLNAVHDNFKFDAEDKSCNGEDDDKACIFRLSAAQVSNGDGRVMLGLKKGYRLKLVIENNPTPIYITPEQFLSLAYEFANYADFYAHGRMYYYAPIWHNVGTEVPQTPSQVGDIGVVRNHWYKLTISSLLKPGIPVSDPTQPIIPNIDPTDRYLGLEIHVLPWHLINQSVVLQ